MTEAEALWEQLADELEATDPAVRRSTMMGLPCLRLDGAFFASFDKHKGGLVVKLGADDVTARIADGRGQPFAPAGKVFREWLVVGGVDAAVWRAAVQDACSFAGMK